MDRINREIEALGRTRTHGELVAALQRVLGQMSYYISQSEGIVLDEQERWHGDYTEALYADAGVARGAARRAAPPAAREGAREGAHEGAPKGPAPGGGLAAHRQAATAVYQRRPRPEDVPPSLRTIYDGTHASFKPDA
jgi:hypothetical protein